LGGERLPRKLEEIKALPRERPKSSANVEEVLELLKTQAYSTLELAEFLGINKASVGSKLKTLLEDGTLEKVFLGRQAYYYIKPSD